MQTNGITTMNKSVQQETAEESKVYKTTNYSLFKGVIGNRELYQPHIRRLLNSVSQKNMLAQNPILVNKEYGVIDGQHRLTVAKELGLPIYYTFVDDAGLMEIQLMNANNRPWLTSDYLESYIAMGKKDYIRLKEFADEYRISVSIAMQITSGIADRSDALKLFRGGKFEITNQDGAENVASLIIEVRKHSPDSAWSHVKCVRALQILSERIDPKLFVSQLERFQIVVTRRSSVKEYLRQFENIINSNSEGKEVTL